MTARWLRMALVGVAALLAADFPAAAPATARDADLIRAAERGDVAAVRRLLADGASVRARDAQGRTALLAATYANRVDAARVLVDAGADVDAKGEISNSAFLLAGAHGDLENALCVEAVPVE
jgi:uncharacterized protein